MVLTSFPFYPFSEGATSKPAKLPCVGSNPNRKEKGVNHGKYTVAKFVEINLHADGGVHYVHGGVHYPCSQHTLLLQHNAITVAINVNTPTTNAASPR